LKPLKLGCVGSGLIGRGWASVFSAAGLEVTLFDSKAGAAEGALPWIRETARFIQEHHLVKSAKIGRLTAAPTLVEAVSDRDYVQESIFEDLRAKKKVFKEISSANPETVIASSTSSLLISKIQAAAKDPSRCLSVHPLNPVYIIPVVEVVGGRMTSQETLATARALMEKVGKIPVSLNFEVPGHVLDRLQAALWREALDLLARGVAGASEIDKAVEFGIGRRWAATGPFLRAHLGGGAGGLEYYFKHIEPSHFEIWNDMRVWKHAPEKAKKKALESLGALTKGLSYGELATRRNTDLLKLVGDLVHPETENA
jgi:carnitine 3-dehydrogenase